MTTEELKELWGEDLFKVFGNHLTEDGWLTEDWGNILEKEVPQFDKDYNDNPDYKETYQRMCYLDHEESDCGKFIRPT